MLIAILRHFTDKTVQQKVMPMTVPQSLPPLKQQKTILRSICETMNVHTYLHTQ
jgi:hypothetical protein